MLITTTVCFVLGLCELSIWQHKIVRKRKPEPKSKPYLVLKSLNICGVVSLLIAFNCGGSNFQLRRPAIFKCFFLLKHKLDKPQHLCGVVSSLVAFAWGKQLPFEKASYLHMFFLLNKTNWLSLGCGGFWQLLHIVVL